MNFDNIPNMAVNPAAVPPKKKFVPNKYPNTQSKSIDTKELFLKTFVSKFVSNISEHDIWTKKEIVDLLIKSVKDVTLPY